MFNVRLRFTSYKVRPVDLIEGTCINTVCLHTPYEEFNISNISPPFRRKN